MGAAGAKPLAVNTQRSLLCAAKFTRMPYTSMP